MIGLLAPAWLAALAALAVPLAVHLWSPRVRHPVRIGSIRLLAGIPPTATRSLRLRDPWLLALRLALLAALVLSLAAPYWAPRDARPGVWALLSTEALADRALLDSLRTAGAAPHLLDAGIPPLGGPGIGRPDGSAAAGPPDRRTARPPNIWSLLAEADRLAPSGTRFVVAAPLATDRIRGVRPAIAAAVSWRAVPRDAGAAPGPAASTAPRRVVILADAAHRDDARYLEAAIRAAVAVAAPAGEITRAAVADAPVAVTDADWIAWLADDPPPTAVTDRVRDGAVLFTETGTDSVAAGASVVRTAAPGPAPVLEHRAPFDGRGAALWTDGTGHPVLTVAREGNGLVYRLYGRIDAAGLALSPTFAVAIAALWRAPDGAIRAPTPAAITEAQALPAAGEAPPARGPPPGAILLATPLWVLAALGFALDRWIAWRGARTRPA